VMDITDIIQEGSKGLIQAVDKISWDVLMASDDTEKTIKSFLSKRIKGSIRRGIDINRGTMRVPEHKINELRKDSGEDRQAVEAFFNSVFTSLDALVDDQSTTYDVPEETQGYNPDLLATYLISLLHAYLTKKEADVIILSYGLHRDRVPARDIAARLGIVGDSAYVRVSQLKRQAINKLMANVDHSQVIDFL
jgi:DNA-directed RNA polymerase sigma subunit (sigma70/sigma32)